MFLQIFLSEDTNRLLQLDHDILFFYEIKIKRILRNPVTLMKHRIYFYSFKLQFYGSCIHSVQLSFNNTLTIVNE